MVRKANRALDQLRDLRIVPHVLASAEGSVEITMGGTRLICAASVDLSLPKWIKKPGMGWVTAEYGMLPRSTHHRMQRNKTATSSRSQEISRLIGRSLRASMDLVKLGERQIHVDCDVIEADGGTRTAAITGGFVALALATQHLVKKMEIKHLPLTQYIAALSLGICQGAILLDLNYEEDQKASTDMNIVRSAKGELIEIQGTAERKAFTRSELNKMLDMSEPAFETLFKEQAKIINSFFSL